MKSARAKNRSGFFSVIRVIVAGPCGRGGTNLEWFDPTCITTMKFDSDLPDFYLAVQSRTAISTRKIANDRLS